MYEVATQRRSKLSKPGLVVTGRLLLCLKSRANVYPYVTKIPVCREFELNSKLIGRYVNKNNTINISYY